MGLSSFWQLTRQTTSSEATKRYWLFYAGPENYLFEGGVRDFPQKTFWSCESETKRGDLILVYRKSVNHLSVNHLVREFGMVENVAKRVKNTGIGKDFPVIWEVTSDAKKKFLWHWPYGCDTKELQRIDPPLTLQELKSEPRLRKWEALRWNLQARKRVALEIPKFAWDVITKMIDDKSSRQLAIQQETSNSTMPRSGRLDSKPRAADTKPGTAVKEKTMEPSEALRIIRSLADGVNPHSGEIFPDDSPYQHPQVLHALFLAVRAMEHFEDRQRRKKLLPANAGKPWNNAEDKILCEEFDSGLTDSELAQKHRRTESAIQSRLEKLGKVPSRFRSP